MNKRPLRPPPRNLGDQLRAWAREDGGVALRLDDESREAPFHVLTSQIFAINAWLRRREIAVEYKLRGRIRVGENAITVKDRHLKREVEARLEVSPSAIMIGDCTITAGAQARRLVALALIYLAVELSADHTANAA